MGTDGPKALAEKAKYNARPDVKKKRAQQNKARRLAEREGLVSKGDGKDVNHKQMLAKGGKTTLGNIEVTSKKENRGWRKDNPEVYGKAKK